MKNIFGTMFGVFGVLLLAGGVPANTQMHKVSKPEVVVRSVGVYEWTGDLAKPTASRLIPVSLFIDGRLEDGGVYLARPVPFTLLTGNVYELDQAGIQRGTLDLVYARHLQATDEKTGATAYDDGWFGYGSFKAAALAKPTVALRKSKTLSVLTSNSADTSKPQSTDKAGGSATAADPDRPTMKRKTDDSSTSNASDGASSKGTAANSPPADPDRPTMKRKTDDTASGASSGASSGAAASTGSDAKSDSNKPADDPDRPTMKRRDDSGSSDTASTSAPAADPDRPTMKRKTDDSASASDSASTKSDSSKPADDPDRPTMKRKSDDGSNGTSTASTGSVPANDPDRPTLKRRSPNEIKKAQHDNGISSVSGVGSLNDDPNRPNLHRGKPAAATTADDLPQLKGMPPEDAQQMVAVSDAKDREPHDFSRTWEDAAERAAVTAKMESLARAELTAYGGSPASAIKAPAPKKAVVPASRARSTKKVETAPAPEPLLDEQLRAYTLSYGGSPTYVFQARTAGDGATLRYVTVVAQPDGVGELQPALKSVTDAAHLDRSPRLRLVDVVDAEASNRASLLFELQGQSSRQFALYRVIGSRADQTFLTGTTQ